MTLGMSVRWRDEDLESTDTRLVEAVVGPSSPLAGQSLAESQLRENYGAVVLAIRQRGALAHSDLQDIKMRLCGDHQAGYPGAGQGQLSETHER